MRANKSLSFLSVPISVFCTYLYHLLTTPHFQFSKEGSVHRKMYSTIIVFTLCVGIGFSATIPMITPFYGCIHNGTQYYFGQTFQPNPCEHCSCVRSGQTLCQQTACRFPSCVDSVQDPSECCPTCPNGEHGFIFLCSAKFSVCYL